MKAEFAMSWTCCTTHTEKYIVRLRLLLSPDKFFLGGNSEIYILLLTIEEADQVKSRLSQDIGQALLVRIHDIGQTLQIIFLKKSAKRHQQILRNGLWDLPKGIERGILGHLSAISHQSLANGSSVLWYCDGKSRREIDRLRCGTSQRTGGHERNLVMAEEVSHNADVGEDLHSIVECSSRGRITVCIHMTCAV